MSCQNGIPQRCWLSSRQRSEHSSISRVSTELVVIHCHKSAPRSSSECSSSSSSMKSTPSNCTLGYTSFISSHNIQLLTASRRRGGSHTGREKHLFAFAAAVSYKGKQYEAVSRGTSSSHLTQCLGWLAGFNITFQMHHSFHATHHSVVLLNLILCTCCTVLWTAIAVWATYKTAYM